MTTPAAPARVQTIVCLVSGCEKQRRERDHYCYMHTSRVRRHGSIDGRAHLPDAPRFWAKVDMAGECWEWKGSRASFGHGAAFFNKRIQTAHRVSWQLAFGAIPTGQCVLHHCDNPPCVRPEHLFLGTRADNARDMAAKGRAARLKGTEHPRAKLTENSARLIRELKSSGWSYARLAQRFGVSRWAVHNVLAGRNWTHA